MSKQRILSELKSLDTDLESTNIKAGLRCVDDINFLDVTIVDGHNNTHQLEMILPSQYPYVPPQIRFVSPISHPYISKTGVLFLDLLGSNWTPVMTIPNILISIESVLSDVDKKFNSLYSS